MKELYCLQAPVCTHRDITITIPLPTFTRRCKIENSTGMCEPCISFRSYDVKEFRSKKVTAKIKTDIKV